MSKIGKKNIIIPKDSSVKIEGSNLTITGPKGTKKLTINDKIFSSQLKESELQIKPLEKNIDKKTSIMWGTYRSLINNAIIGVSVGHEKILELNAELLKLIEFRDSITKELQQFSKEKDYANKMLLYRGKFLSLWSVYYLKESLIP